LPSAFTSRSRSISWMAASRLPSMRSTSASTASRDADRPAFLKRSLIQRGICPTSIGQTCTNTPAASRALNHVVRCVAASSFGSTSNKAVPAGMLAA